jgi:hypothetical protein
MTDREHVVSLWNELARVPESGWNLLLIRELRARPATFDYLCSASVEGAMLDAGAPVDLVEKVCRKLQAAKMLLPAKLRIRMGNA